MRLVFEYNFYEGVFFSVLLGLLKKNGLKVRLSYDDLMAIPLSENLSLDERLELCSSLFLKRVTVYYVQASKMSTNVFLKFYDDRHGDVFFEFDVCFVDAVKILGFKKTLEDLKMSVKK